MSYTSPVFKKNDRRPGKLAYEIEFEHESDDYHFEVKIAELGKPGSTIRSLRSTIS
jgi:hypothetical protein